MDGQEDIRFLLVDDHVYVRSTLHRLISTLSRGKVVAEAENGADALHLISVHRPHVVLMDIVMPVMDGLQAAEHIRREYPEIHLILYTSHDKQRFQHRVRELGIDAIYIKEELTLSELQRLVNEWFGLPPKM